jgi:hypothetical protein
MTLGSVDANGHIFRAAFGQFVERLPGMVHRKIEHFLAILACKGYD